MKWFCQFNCLNKVLLFGVVAIFSPSSFAQSAHEGNYIVVRGALQSCEKWNFRILDVVKIEGTQPVEILGLQDMELLGLTKEQVSAALVTEINRRTGHAPDSLRIEILESDLDYRAITNEYLISLKAMLDGGCPKELGFPPEPKSLDEQMEKVRRMELAESIV